RREHAADPSPPRRKGLVAGEHERRGRARMTAAYAVQAREHGQPWRTVYSREVHRTGALDGACGHYEDVRARMVAGMTTADELRLTRDDAQLARTEARWVRRL